MPNWACNRIIPLTPEDADKIAQFLSSDPNETEENNCYLDFEKIKPVPACFRTIDHPRAFSPYPAIQRLFSRNLEWDWFNPLLLIHEALDDIDTLQRTTIPDLLHNALGLGNAPLEPSAQVRYDEVVAHALSKLSSWGAERDTWLNPPANDKNRVIDPQWLTFQLRNWILTGHSNEYTWRIDNWGTKWNSCATAIFDMKVGDNIVQAITFDTAWSPVPELLAELARISGASFYYFFAEEQLTEMGGEIFYSTKFAPEDTSPIVYEKQGVDDIDNVIYFLYAYSSDYFSDEDWEDEDYYTTQFIKEIGREDEVRDIDEFNPTTKGWKTFVSYAPKK